MRYVVLAYKDEIIDVKRGPRPADPGETQGGLKVFPGSSLWSSGTGIGRGNIFERVELGDDRVAFKSIVTNADTGQHEYIQADHDTDLPYLEDHGVPGLPTGLLRVLPMEAPGEWETFREIWIDDTFFALETWRQFFVTAEGDGGGLLTINRDVIGEWQRFHYRVPPEGLLPVEPPEPTVAEQASGTVEQARTQVEGIPVNPRGTVQDASPEIQRPQGLRDKILRRFGR